nr:ABC transporter ATP-binding protein [Xylanibacterium ulmi]
MLSIDNLTVTVASTPESGHRRVLLDGVSLRVGAGERVGLIGESGSGKSLLSLASIGLLPEPLDATGSVSLGGRELLGASERAWNAVRGRDVALVFQEPTSALDPLMRLGRQVAGPLRRRRGLRGAPLRAEVRRVLREVQLDDADRIARSFPHEVSGGQRQRVAIAMALACDPQLLIADEPTTALDVTVQKEILRLIADVAQQRGMSLLFVSHDIGAVASMASRVVVLQHGRVVESGPTQQLIRQPAHPYTQRLVAGARALDERLTIGAQHD